jgi:hypothetical protein
MTSAPVTTRRAFIDAVQEAVARLILDEQIVHLPAALLPPGCGEGTWIELTLRAVPAPTEAAETEAARAALSGDDDGGDLKP